MTTGSLYGQREIFYTSRPICCSQLRELCFIDIICHVAYSDHGLHASLTELMSSAIGRSSVQNIILSDYCYWTIILHVHILHNIVGCLCHLCQLISLISPAWDAHPNITMPAQEK